MDDTVKATLRETFSGMIWRIAMDDRHHFVAVETRDPATRTAAFSGFNYQTGECYFKEIVLENNWWLSLDKVSENRVFLHGYATENSPERKGIIALDALSGTVAWQQYAMALENISEEGPVVYQTAFTPKRFSILSAATGHQVRDPAGTYPIVYQSIKIPNLWDEQLPLPHYLPETITGPVFYSELNGKDCWSFHVKTAGGFSQMLLIAQESTILLADFLTENIQKLNPEAFFIQNSHLFCTRNKTEIVSYLV